MDLGVFDIVLSYIKTQEWTTTLISDRMVEFERMTICGFFLKVSRDSPLRHQLFRIIWSRIPDSAFKRAFGRVEDSYWGLKNDCEIGSGRPVVALRADIDAFRFGTNESCPTKVRI